MPYLIDGHNLIPKIPGLSLSELDDEARLLELLQTYCRMQRKQAEVFFDNAPPGGTRVRNLGLVVAHFVRQGLTADQAIYQRLGQLGRGRRNWTVISSDLAVQAAARRAQARFLSSEAFAAQLIQALDQAGEEAGGKSDVQLGEAEVDEWLRLFGEEG